MSKIAESTAQTILAIFAGRTVNRDEVSAQITMQYAMAQKKTGVGSYFQVFDIIEASGVSFRYTGPDFTGESFYTFPSAA